jgi:hypothetical protein
MENQKKQPGQKEGQQVKPALPVTVEIMTEQDEEATRKFLLNWHRADASKLDAALEYGPTLAEMFDRAKQAGEVIKDWASRNLPFSYMTATKIRRLHAWKELPLAAREAVGDKLPIGVELGIELIKRAKAEGLAPGSKPAEPLLLELCKDAKAAFDTKKAKERKAPAGAEEPCKEGGGTGQQGKREQAQQQEADTPLSTDRAGKTSDNKEPKKIKNKKGPPGPKGKKPALKVGDVAYFVTDGSYGPPFIGAMRITRIGEDGRIWSDMGGLMAQDCLVTRTGAVREWKANLKEVIENKRREVKELKEMLRRGPEIKPS